jgi:hypothetical protein
MVSGNVWDTSLPAVFVATCAAAWKFYKIHIHLGCVESKLRLAMFVSKIYTVPFRR